MSDQEQDRWVNILRFSMQRYFLVLRHGSAWAANLIQADLIRARLYFYTHF